MKSNTNISILFLLMITLFILNPSETKHRSKLTQFISERTPELEQEIIEQRVTKLLICKDNYLFSSCRIKEVQVTKGYLGRITVLNESEQQLVFQQLGYASN